MRDLAAKRELSQCGEPSGVPSKSEQRARSAPALPRARAAFPELWLQRCIGRLALLPLGIAITALLRIRGRYRIVDREKVRERFRELTRSRQPLIVCANHLTIIDSVLLLWALASVRTYLRDYHLFCWNLPAVENAKKRWSWRIITYLSKCILVNRLGDVEHTGAILDKTRHLLRSGDLVMMFPEGMRSRSGRVDPELVTYGIGKLMRDVANCRVLCIYMRGRGQHTYSDFPKRGEVFDLEMEIVVPQTNQPGLRGIRERSLAVISKLKEMEDRYFAQQQQRIDRQ